jgi:AraC family transcriptional regulator of adaptative response/methylated-DNA-[protein]-cysteine methyltransferase
MERASGLRHTGLMMTASMAIDEAQCWKGIQRKDKSLDGSFFYGVTTTGVFCRPSCAARRPLRQNVRFYETAEEAQRDGLRPCLRCRPLESATDSMALKIGELCRYIEAHPDGRLSLQELADRAGLSRFHLQRSFKAVTGITPKQYAEARRIGSLKTGLREARDVAAAIYDAGFGSSSRVYEHSDARLGMTPNQYRQGGRGIAITYATAASAVGLMMIGATDRGICFVQFGNSEEELLELLRKEFPAANLEPMSGGRSSQLREWIDALAEHLRAASSTAPPLDVHGTAFQVRVWTYLQSIPRGEVRSYAQVAEGIGQPTATRAVARACATNRVAVLIPCHRVIRGTGEPGGYRWGLERKRALMEIEKTAYSK